MKNKNNVISMEEEKKLREMIKEMEKEIEKMTPEEKLEWDKWVEEEKGELCCIHGDVCGCSEETKRKHWDKIEGTK